MNGYNLADRLNYTQVFGNRARRPRPGARSSCRWARASEGARHAGPRRACPDARARWRRCRAAARPAQAWVDGRVTAGEQSALAKRNLQVPEDAPAARELGEMILTRAGTQPDLRLRRPAAAGLSAAVQPLRQGMGFDTHVDNAIRFAGPVRFRTDLSATLFLTDPDDYDGGELIVEDAYGEHAVKLPAGDMILYPATSLHRVAPITRGSRWAASSGPSRWSRDDARRGPALRPRQRHPGAERQGRPGRRRRGQPGRDLQQPAAHVGRGLSRQNH